MIKAIIFDFDGVIAESVDIKTEAFRELFREYPDHMEEFIQYQLRNGGVSRFEKIKHFYRRYLNKEITSAELNELCLKYSQLVVDKVISAAWVEGALDLLEKCLPQ